MSQTTLSSNDLARVSELSNQLTGIINTGTGLNLWEGKMPTINPKTGELTGNERKTLNLDVIVPQDLFLSVQKGLTKLSGTGEYFRVKYRGVELVAIAARMDEIKNLAIVQCQPPNVGRFHDSNDPQFGKAFDEAISKFMSNNITSSSSKAPVTNESNSDSPNW